MAKEQPLKIKGTFNDVLKVAVRPKEPKAKKTAKKVAKRKK